MDNKMDTNVFQMVVQEIQVVAKANKMVVRANKTVTIM